MGVIHTPQGTVIRTNGQGKPKPKAPKVVMKWYPVLQTHAAGNLIYKIGSLRGIPASKSSTVEGLVRRGLIDPTPVTLPEDAVATKTNPTEAMLHEDQDKDQVRNILNKAAATAWKPGMKIPPRVDQPVHGLPSEGSREEALHRVDRAVDSELAEQDGEEPKPPTFRRGGKK